MHKQIINYVDFNDTERTEAFYFNLTTTELLELNKSVEGGFETALTNAMRNEDAYAVYELIQKTILKSIGQKSDDGKFFKKTPEYTADFESSAAYQSMLEEFVNHPDRANAFITGILPRELREKAMKADASKALETLVASTT